MKPFANALCIVAGLSLALVGPATAQEEKNKILDDALEALEKAKRRQILDDSAEKLRDRKDLLDPLRKRAEESRKKTEFPSVDVDSVKSRAQTESLIKQASPEVRRLIARSRGGGEIDDSQKTTSKPKVVKPAADATDPTATAAPSVGGVPIPLPDTGLEVPLERLGGTEGDVHIVCKGNSFYDKSGNIVLFRKDVVATHPGFVINCQEMEVLLEDDTFGDGGKPKPVTPKEQQDGSGIRRAIARGMGSQVDLIRHTPKGDLTGKCGYAIYDGQTGDIELHDWPALSNGTRIYRAKEKDTVMIIRKNGNHKVTGGKAIEEVVEKSGN
jgi:hypothetical protein